jgi:hypothetical protein
MPAPRGATYVPKSGPLAGRVFTGQEGTTQAYNAYQAARAREVIGVPSYRAERQLRQSQAAKALFTADRKSVHYGGVGKLQPQRRTELLQILVQHKDVDMQDHRRGGSLDNFLRALGRRAGNETWAPGETPKRS